MEQAVKKKRNNYTMHYRNRDKVRLWFIMHNASEKVRISQTATERGFVTVRKQRKDMKRSEKSRMIMQTTKIKCVFEVSKLSKDLLAGGEQFTCELCGGGGLNSLDDRSRSNLYSFDRSCYSGNKLMVLRA